MSKVKVDQERVKEVFEHYPKAQSVFVTSDGTIFIDKNKSYARYHAQQTKQELVEVPRVAQEETSNKKSEPQLEDWKKSQASIAEKAKSIGLEFPVTVKKNADKIAMIEATLAESAKKKSDNGDDQDDDESSESKESGLGDDVPGSNGVTDHKTQE